MSHLASCLQSAIEKVLLANRISRGQAIWEPLKTPLKTYILYYFVSFILVIMTEVASLDVNLMSFPKLSINNDIGWLVI